MRLVVRTTGRIRELLDIHPADAAVTPRNRQEQSSGEGQVVNVTAGSFFVLNPIKLSCVN